MFKSYHNFKTVLSATFLSSALLLTACNANESTENVKKAATKTVAKTKEVSKTATTSAPKVLDNMGGSRTYKNGKLVIDGGVTYPVKDEKSGPYYVNTQDIKGFVFGRTPTKNEIEAWNIDVMPDGTGLPEGKGSVEEGDEIYEEKCVSCHGDFGSGGGGYPALAKGPAEEGHKTLTYQRLKPDDDGPIRVFGTYWPYASTLWWYIKTGMPHTAPMSLTDDEVYALCAYILNINEMSIDGEEVDDEYVLNREKFLKIKMPNVDGFIPKVGGKDGIENVRAFYADPKNYGNGTRCMKDCFEGEPKVQPILIPITDFNPPLTNKKDLPKDNGDQKVIPGQKLYKANCVVCHGNDSMGAPVAGNKEDWDKVMKQGMDTVLKNAIEGKNAMPPRGGTSLSDDDIKLIIEYMIKNK